ncbi:sigma-54-dependent transcriptional regulator [Thalassomonas actiniarum]|uniref:Sigma-54-dependent Fis family transcriptional regulator n=1 Tax=Thalassomonas actiniarum TaxID=485447 RepID=A0AAE9YTI2_9GAMM|nr:sigma-54 dependent transcriptional regulator [Thalassomonas actiniarum]WDE00487.1 sigma-54-dependent Fis family transcriptional regulator [Thalassomonas actiniarum]
MITSKLLVVEDDAGLREALVDTLLLAGYQCLEAESGEAALLQLKSQHIDLVVSDVNMGGMSGLSLLKSIKSNYPNMPVLLMTAYGTIDDAVQAMKDGACNYMAKPFAPEVLLNMVSQYVPLQVVNHEAPIAEDARSKELLTLAQKVASTDASVMVLGPSGSGKEVLAQFVHYNSPRADQPFVAINCAAIPENMLEATLFGYEKGAFTGAIQACPGKFEQAQGGTILLDEITEMDLGLQAKILRVLQEREVERLGGRKTISLDVRVIATSNRDLKEAVAEGVFREDLYYRLNVFPLTWLPLGQRRDDILPLAKHLVKRHSQKNGNGVAEIEFSASARSKLIAYQWPGNVRELDNVIQRALILHTDNMIDATDLLIENFDTMSINTSLNQQPVQAQVPQAQPVIPAADDKLGSELKLQEHQIILDTLQTCQGSRKEVADRLGISPRTLRYKIARMRDSGIQIPA